MPFDILSGVVKDPVRRDDEKIIDALLWSSVSVKITLDVDSTPQSTITDEPYLVQAFSVAQSAISTAQGYRRVCAKT